LGAFCFLFACSKAENPLPATNPPEKDTTPLLTLSELLNADDVKQGLALASENNDQQAISEWQARLIDAAKQVNLKTSELELLKGEQGKVFLDFQGMKTNYQQDFERAFFNFEDVDAVYERYPAFQSLHEQSKALVQKRDVLVGNIALSLEQDGMAPDQASNTAKQQWQDLMLQQR
jgi:hypothetical protein